MSLGVIRLRYGIEKAGVDLYGYRDGEFKKFLFHTGQHANGEDKYQTVVVGSYEGYRDGLEFLMYHLLKVMDGDDFALYHRKGTLITTPNVTLKRLNACGVSVYKDLSIDTHNDHWSIESDNIILKL